MSYVEVTSDICVCCFLKSKAFNTVETIAVLGLVDTSA